jgi:hypothetical protein
VEHTRTKEKREAKEELAENNARGSLGCLGRHEETLNN